MKITILLLSLLIMIPVVAGTETVVPDADPRSTAVAGSGRVINREMLVQEPVFNGTVYVTEAGKEHDTSIVLVHGAGDRAARDWEAVIPGLAQRYHVLAFDLPGYSRSSKSNLLYSPARYAVFIQWLVNRYVGQKPFVLAGHSMGGAIALRYAVDYPDRLQRLILVDAAGILHRTAFLKGMYTMKEREAGAGMRLLLRTDEFDDFVRFIFDELSNDERAGKMEQALHSAPLRKLMLGGDPKKISGLATILEDFSAGVEQLRVPTLLIWGGDDTIAPIRTAKALLGRLPEARLETIAGSGHVPMMDNPEEFLRIVKSELVPGRAQDSAKQVTAPQKSETRIVRFNHQRDLVLTGSYKKIELNHCTGVRIANATIDQIEISHSDVIFENCRIAGTAIGLRAVRSEIIGTNLDIEAETAIHASRSRIDLAGSRLRGKKAAVASVNRSLLIFSISHSESPHYSGPIHGSRTITRKSPL